MPETSKCHIAPRNNLFKFLQLKRLKWSDPSEFGMMQEEITKVVLSRLLDLMKMTHDALVSKSLKLISG